MHRGWGKDLRAINNGEGLRAASTNRGLWKVIAAVGAGAFAVEIPFFFQGTPSGHDFEFHLNSWLDVLAQWKQGIFFPRWASWANFGYGEPRFIFYPPASWMLGAILSAIFPWGIVSCVYIWIALTLAGLSMFALARRWFSPRDAIFASVLYAVNPYHLVIVYWRSAFAELLASCLLPILLLLVLRIADGERRLTLPLAAVLAAAWLSNAPAAVMIHYSLALLLVIFAWQKRSLRILGVGAAAVVLGAGLASFYLLPAIYEQRWVDIGKAIAGGSRTSVNFLFAHTTDVPHDQFNRIISWVAVFEMVILFAAAVVAKLRKQMNCETWNALSIWVLACSVLMFPVTAIAWRILPKLQFMQFPWRWMLCLSMMFAALVTAGTLAAGTSSAFRAWGTRAAVFVAGVVVIVAAWNFIQPPWWDNLSDLREMQDNITDHIGYEGTEEYTPVGATPSSTNKDASYVSVAGPGQAVISVSQWGAEKKSFAAEASVPTQLVLRLFRYPAWRVEINGREVQTSGGVAGQMIVPVNAGVNQVQITWARTWDRTLGGWISVVTAFCAGAWLIFSRRE
ncbi:MAG: 6-pyruvoyl-tetrahydropterin synthase-related protein [Candidatus Sulfotelmatobacter sp.]